MMGRLETGVAVGHQGHPGIGGKVLVHLRVPDIDGLPGLKTEVAQDAFKGFRMRFGAGDVLGPKSPGQSHPSSRDSAAPLGWW